MKTKLLLVFLLLNLGISHAQEWFTNMDVAGRLALVQNKMLFVVWEASFDGSIPVVVKSENGTTVIIDMANDTSLDSVIRDYFVPVRLPESNYEHFLQAAEGRSYRYINKLTDNSIKIMDVNGNILNVNDSIEEITNFSELVDTYALNTVFLTMELRNYAKERTYLTAYLLGEKYTEYSIYAKKSLRDDIIDLATIYLNESEKLVASSNVENPEVILQKIELIRIEQALILGKTGKARRQLKRIDGDEIAPVNERFYAFLHYTIHRLREDIAAADLWKSKLSSLDLKKAEMIMNIHTYGTLN